MAGWASLIDSRDVAEADMAKLNYIGRRAGDDRLDIGLNPHEVLTSFRRQFAPAYCLVVSFVGDCNRSTMI